MRDLTRLAGFLVAVVLVFGLAFGIGRAVGPIGAAPEPAPQAPTTVTTSTMDHQPGPTIEAPAGSGSHAGSHPTTTST